MNKNFLTFSEAMKQANSSTNQEIKGRFVNREIMMCCTSIVEYIIKASDIVHDAPFSMDDIENYYQYNEIEYLVNGNAEYFTGSEDDKKKLISEILSEYGDEANEAINSLEDADTEAQEIFEWWGITNWLYEKLKEKNQPVVTDGFNHFWGRTCTGQAILLDHVISEICADLQILEGQESAWTK